jgi:hypothetical protein
MPSLLFRSLSAKGHLLAFVLALRQSGAGLHSYFQDTCKRSICTSNQLQKTKATVLQGQYGERHTRSF